MTDRKQNVSIFFFFAFEKEGISLLNAGLGLLIEIFEKMQFSDNFALPEILCYMD